MKKLIKNIKKFFRETNERLVFMGILSSAGLFAVSAIIQLIITKSFLVQLNPNFILLTIHLLFSVLVYYGTKEVLDIDFRLGYIIGVCAAILGLLRILIF